MNKLDLGIIGGVMSILFYDCEVQENTADNVLSYWSEPSRRVGMYFNDEELTGFLLKVKRVDDEWFFDIKYEYPENDYACDFHDCADTTVGLIPIMTSNWNKRQYDVAKYCKMISGLIESSGLKVAV